MLDTIEPGVYELPVQQCDFDPIFWTGFEQFWELPEFTSTQTPDVHVENFDLYLLDYR